MLLEPLYCDPQDLFLPSTELVCRGVHLSVRDVRQQYVLEILVCFLQQLLGGRNRRQVGVSGVANREDGSALNVLANLDRDDLSLRAPPL